jgi:hypothetical protein
MHENPAFAGRNQDPSHNPFTLWIGIEFPLTVAFHPG